MKEETKKEIKVEAKSLKTGGIKDDQDQWWNFKRNTAMTKDQEETLRKINKGDVIKLTVCDVANREYSDLEIIQQTEVGRNFDDYVKFADLLQKAHEKFGKCFSIKTRLLEVSTMDMPVFEARIEIWEENLVDGKFVRICVRHFTAHGDANEENVTDMTKKHLVRMAETRAIARALRFALGEGKTAMEEIDSLPLTEEKIGE